MNTNTIQQPKRFRDLAVKEPEIQGFEGLKIEPAKLFGREITVHRFHVGPSTLPGKEATECLTLQISLDGTKRVVFSGSKYLIAQCRQLKEDDFPFITTIVKKDNDSHSFT